jgi:hypothetical protein
MQPSWMNFVDKVGDNWHQLLKSMESMYLYPLAFVALSHVCLPEVPTHLAKGT